jgi:signal-transduction protein with cAMP-binding, CBS, and nucleotidyltransferase domain
MGRSPALADPGRQDRPARLARGTPWATAAFRLTVADAMAAAPAHIPVGTDCAAAVARMAALAAACVVVVDESGRPIGLLTEQDVSRRIAFQVPPGTPVETVMNRAVPTVLATERLFRVLARMRHQRLRDLLVTDADGRVLGLLDLGAGLGAIAQGVAGRLEVLVHDDSNDGLRATKSAQVAVARDMLDEGVPAPEIQAFLTEINRDLYCRIVDRSLAAMADEGWGRPPVALCVLIMGSGGRGENLLDPDQDNGFVLADYPDDEHGPIDRFFVELAERMTRDLDATGIPFCKGGVMATNPLWRKTLTQWQDQIVFWAKRRSGGATLLADIFFDFQAVHGDPAMAAHLRRHVTDLSRRHRALLQSMAHDDTMGGVALNLFGRFAREGADSLHRGRIELKIHGRQPLVGCIRLLALAAGIEETSTLGRIARLGERGVLVPEDVEGLVDAYHHIATLMLRQQADIEGGRMPGEYVETSSLSAQGRARLLDSLRMIDRLRKRTQIDLVGQTL